MSTGFRRLVQQLQQALRAHLDGVKRPQVPEAGRDLWRWFHDLHAARQWHASGPQPLGFAEIEAWARMRGQRLEQRHIDALRALDGVWTIHFYEGRGKRNDTSVKRLPGLSSHELTPELFDAVCG